MVGYLDDPFIIRTSPSLTGSAFSHFVSKLAHDNGVKVVQVGEGSDEHCGYNGYMKYLELNERYLSISEVPSGRLAKLDRGCGSWSGEMLSQT